MDLTPRWTVVSADEQNKAQVTGFDNQQKLASERPNVHSGYSQRSASVYSRDGSDMPEIAD